MNESRSVSRIVIDEVTPVKRRRRSDRAKLVTEALSLAAQRLDLLADITDPGHVPMIIFLRRQATRLRLMREEFIERCMIESGEAKR